MVKNFVYGMAIFLATRTIQASEFQVELDLEGFGSEFAPVESELPENGFNIRLDKEGGSLQFAEVINQEDLGICATSAVTTALAAFQLDPRPLSFIEAAVDAILVPLGAKEFFMGSVEAGNAFTARPFSAGFGGESKLTSSKSKIESWWGYNTRRLHMAVKSYNSGNAVRAHRERDLLGGRDRTLGFQLAKMYRTFSEIKKYGLDSQDALEYLSKSYPDLPRVISKKVIELRAPVENKISKLWEMLYHRAEVQVKDRLEVKLGSPSTVADIENGIRYHFINRNQAPLGIDYCARYLSDGEGYRGVVSRGSLFSRITASVREDCGFHASVLIGYRIDESSHKEEVLIQNSWGKSCMYYKTEFSCEEGKIWVPLQSLKHNVLNYWRLEKIEQ